jgi:hypothetical protein
MLRLPKIRPGEEVAAKLNKIIDWQGIDDVKVTLQEALDAIAKMERLTFDIKVGALDETVDYIAKTEIANPNPLLPMKTSVATILKRILARVPAQSGATWLIRRDHIEITTVDAQRAEIMGKDYTGPMPPLVYLTADKKPLDEVLAHLADQGERNIAIDPRVGDRVQAPITTYLINKPIDAAVYLVADMARLSFVRIDNTYYITSPDRAAAMKAEWKAHRPAAPAPATIPARREEKVTK